MLREGAISALNELLRGVDDIRKHASLKWEVSHAQHLAGDPQTLGEAVLCETLGRYEGARGNYRAALRITERALPVCDRVLGGDHPGVLTTRGNIAILTGQTGDRLKALQLSQDLLPDLERVLGKDHPSVLKIRGSIAGCTERGDRREALRLLQQLCRTRSGCWAKTIRTRS